MADLLTDSHCHLDDEEFDGDREEVVERALSSGVKRMVTIGSLKGVAGAERSLSIAGSHAGSVWAVVGIHPHDASIADAAALASIEDLAHDARVVGIGETGLDYHYDNSPRGIQRDVFRSFIGIARRLGKPLVIHSREAMPDAIRILDEEDGWSTGGVFHCFSGDRSEADVILGRGWYLSFAGVVTFPKAERARSILASAPGDRILVETDAPYLAPVPNRGRRNEPAHVRLVAETVARVRQIDLEEAAALTSGNASRLFGLG